MDIATVACVGGGFFLVLFGTLVAGLSPLDLYDTPSVFITVGGGLASTVGTTTIGNLVSLWSYTKWAFFPKKYDMVKLILDLVNFSERARREGLLSLEDDLSNIDEAFLRKGIQLVVDGTDPELVRNILQADIDNMHSRHEGGWQFWANMGFYLPAFGMIGTLIGLVQMLKNLGGGDPSAIGNGMAAALITTLYGSLMANVVALPIKNKLQFRDSEEMAVRAVMVEGILSIQSGDNPRIVKDKLASYLPPSERTLLDEGTGER